MIFVSYSHPDEQWRQRFETISKPMSRETQIEFWSDKKLKAGKWEKQIEAAKQKAQAAVLLVSPAFLASDYITQKELPYFLKAHEERNLTIFWFNLEPCDLKWHPEIKEFQAITLGDLKPLSSLTDWEWQETMVHGCGMIDDCEKTFEQPVINPDINNKSFDKRTKDLRLLAKPARRDVEVLVYSADKKWWRQSRLKAGSSTTTLYLGDEQTKPGTSFKVIALTTDQPLMEPNYLNVPRHRTKTIEITLFRK
jgi:TIR domain